VSVGEYDVEVEAVRSREFSSSIEVKSLISSILFLSRAVKAEYSVVQLWEASSPPKDGSLAVVSDVAKLD
jgi:hypothetical protein